MQHANLELDDKQFRKIKSLHFLYEVNASGNIIRNAKSKRHIAQRKTYRGYWMITVLEW